MVILILACTEYTPSPISLGELVQADPPARRSDPALCGGLVSTGLDPCGTGEALHVGIAGEALAGRYALSGTACVFSAYCDADWLVLWIVEDTAACQWPDEAQPIPLRLSADLDYAVCLTASPPQGGSVGSCALDTSAGRYDVIVENQG
jgi:hypothetical protein